MKIICYGVLLALLATVGCNRQESPPSAEKRDSRGAIVPELSPVVKAAYERQRAIVHPMTRPEVFRVMGTPQSTNSDGSFVWEVADGKQKSVLTVYFGPGGTVSRQSTHVQYTSP